MEEEVDMTVLHNNTALGWLRFFLPLGMCVRQQIWMSVSIATEEWSVGAASSIDQDNG